MASNHTANYGLSQWEPGDAFVREEFNGDHAKIDAAIRCTEDKAERALTGLAYVGYNVYNLALQDYYDGKETGWKKAMVFDGFADGSLIASLSPSIVRAQNKLSLTRSGQGDISLGYGGTTAAYVGAGVATKVRTVGAAGRLTGIRIKTVIKANSDPGSGSVQYTVTLNGRTAASGTATVNFPAAAAEQTIFFGSITVGAGDTVSVAVKTSFSGYLLYMDGGSNLGGYLLISAVEGDSGTVLTPVLALPERQELRAWVRHQGGGVGIAVTGSDGVKRSMELVGTRQSRNLQGAACTEAEFRLGELPKDGSLRFTLSADLGVSNSMDIFDYGVVLF